MEINVLIALAGMMGSGFSAYVGVRVALAEVKGDVRRLQEDVAHVEERVERLEKPYFERR